MGVFALTSFCDDSEVAWQPVNLTEVSAQQVILSVLFLLVSIYKTPCSVTNVFISAQVAEGQPRLTLVVDGLCLFHVLFEEATCPEWEWIAGGNYAVLASALESYVLRLRQARHPDINMNIHYTKGTHLHAKSMCCMCTRGSCVNICVRIHGCMCIFVYVYSDVYLYMYVYVSVCVDMCTYVYILDCRMHVWEECIYMSRYSTYTTI